MNINKLNEVKTSYELFEVLNHFRVEAGEKPYRRHYDLVRQIKKECSDFRQHQTVLAENDTTNNNNMLEAYLLTRKQVFKTAMRESSKVRDLVYDYLESLEIKNRKLQSVVYEVIRGQKYISQEQALKCAGILHPRLFMKLLKGNKLWLDTVMSKGYIEYKTINQHKDRAWRFTQGGFEWLVDNCDKANEYVGSCKHKH